MKVNLIKSIFLYLVTTYLISPKLKTYHGRIQIGLYFNRVDKRKKQVRVRSHHNRNKQRFMARHLQFVVPKITPKLPLTQIYVIE